VDLKAGLNLVRPDRPEESGSAAAIAAAAVTHNRRQNHGGCQKHEQFPHGFPPDLLFIPF